MNPLEFLKLLPTLLIAFSLYLLALNVRVAKPLAIGSHAFLMLLNYALGRPVALATSLIMIAAWFVSVRKRREVEARHIADARRNSG